MISDNAKAIRLLLVDRHEVVRAGLRAFVSTCNIDVVGESGTVSGALAEARRLKPHVVLMDMQLPDGCSLQGCRNIRAACPDVRVLFLTACNNDEDKLASICAGADGYLLKDEVKANTLIHAIETVAAGLPIIDTALILSLLKRVQAHAPPLQGTILTPQERRILPLVADGKTNKEIGDALGLSHKTVKNYLSHIFQKLHVTRRSQVTALFVGGILK